MRSKIELALVLAKVSLQVFFKKNSTENGRVDQAIDLFPTEYEYEREDRLDAF